MIPLEIATGFYRTDSLPLSAQRCVNWLPIVPETSALSQRALFDVPGLLTHTTTGDTINGANRGSQMVDRVSYWVNGETLYSLDNKGIVTDRGFIIGSSRVSLANNGRYLVIVVPGITAYAYDNTTNILAEITDSSFRLSDTVVFKDGYFVFTATDGSVFFNSALNDPFTFNALDFGTAEINPDRIVAAHVNHNELFIAGEVTCELFQNIGTAGFPFQRIPGANIQKGIHAKFSLVEFDNTFLFVGGGQNELSAIWTVASSANAQKISTAAIDNAIQEFTFDEISRAFAMSYSFGGNFFASFTFESTRIPSKTFVFDATTSALTQRPEWHERQSGVSEGRWRVSSVLNAFGELLVGDSIDGRIGKFDKNTHTEYGDVIYRERASQPFSNEGLPIFAGEVRLTMESGTGVTTGQGSDPQIRMDFSDNGARTFSSEFWRSYGKTGEYKELPTWRRQGRIPRHRVLRFKTTEPAKSVIIMLEADAESGV